MKTVQCITANAAGFVMGNQITDDITDGVLAFEEKRLGIKETISLFQTLIDRRIIAKMSPRYKQIARQLLEDGQCRNNLAA